MAITAIIRMIRSTAVMNVHLAIWSAVLLLLMHLTDALSGLGILGHVPRPAAAKALRTQQKTMT